VCLYDLNGIWANSGIPYGSGWLAFPQMLLVPANPNASHSRCVPYYGTTAWYKVEFLPFECNTPAMLNNVEWSNSAWLLGRNDLTARLTHDGPPSATLTASLGEPWPQIGGISASRTFYICGGSNNTNCLANIYNVRLTSSKHLLSLEPDECYADLHTLHDPTPLINDYRIEISYTNQINWFTLSDTRNLLPWDATVAAAFYLRSVVTFDNAEHASSNITVIVNFQEDHVIEADPVVSNAMDQAWANTKAYTLANPHLLREEGFYITFDTATKTYSIIEYREGDPVHVDAFSSEDG
jgi:hypothetical protein